mmetsp:Transcript_2424/g.5496  ORF Transcript_2424/g.5496 Transcript_2424/m.5496 type:complete len:253 (-) Transcript_2424:99-857(-)
MPRRHIGGERTATCEIFLFFVNKTDFNEKVFFFLRVCCECFLLYLSAAPTCAFSPLSTCVTAKLHSICRLLLRWRRAWHFLCQRREELVHILRRFGGRLEEEQPVLVCVCLCLLRAHLPFASVTPRRQVCLVPRKSHDEVLVPLPHEFAHPRLCAREALWRRDVVNDDRRGCASVVHGCERVVPLLSRCVPDFEFETKLRHGFGQECRADGGFLVVFEVPLDKSLHERGLSRAHVSKEDELFVDDGSLHRYR